MSTLKEIDELFKEAQQTIIDGHPEQTRTVLWPRIEQAIENTEDLSREKRRRLTSLIVECLDRPRFFQSEEKPEPLSIDELMTRLQGPEDRPPLGHAW